MVPSPLTTMPGCLPHAMAYSHRLGAHPFCCKLLCCMIVKSRNWLPSAGNGIQNILYKTGNVMYISLHR